MVLHIGKNVRMTLLTGVVQLGFCFCENMVCARTYVCMSCVCVCMRLASKTFLTCYVEVFVCVFFCLNE